MPKIPSGGRRPQFGQGTQKGLLSAVNKTRRARRTTVKDSTLVRRDDATPPWGLLLGALSPFLLSSGGQLIDLQRIA